MQIAFWSPNHGQTGTTTAALTYAAYIALTNNLKILVGHSQMERSTLESCFIAPQKDVDKDWSSFKDHGLSGLRRLANNGRLVKGVISDYTTSLLSNMSLDLLEASNEIKSYSDEEEIALLRHIFSMATVDYDIVFLDLHSGINTKLTNQLIEDSDIVVVCLNQNCRLIEEFLETKNKQSILANKTCIYNIGFYDSESRYTAKNLQHRYKLGTTIVLPYHAPYLDACNNHQALDYIMRHINTKTKYSTSYFIKKLEQSTGELMEKIGVLDQEVFE